ncbi:MAG: polyprenyl synthetase family protein [Acidobacteriota bacterium]
MNDLESFFAGSARDVDAAIDGLIDDARIASDRLRDAMKWSLFGGGKRFRPTLVFAVGETLDVPREKLLRTAAAVEMIHTYSLIHDDLPAMDDDDLRRGRDTCHKKYGEATAILAGDALQVLSFEALAEDDGLPADVRLKLISNLATAACRMVVGQQADLEAEGRPVTPAELELIHRNKTGALIRFSAEAGALIAQASANDLGAVAKYGAKLGLLFQITDDVLDVVQTTESLGKTAGKDASASKATYPAIFGIEGARAAAVRAHGEAVEAISGLSKPAGRLREIADFIVDRQR